MRKLTIGVCFLSLFALFFIYQEKPVERVEIKKETEKTAPSVEDVISTPSADSEPPSSYLYRGNWINKSGNNLTRLQFKVENNVVNGFVSINQSVKETFKHVSFTGMIHGDTIEGVFKNKSGENGVVTIKEKGTELLVKVALTNETKNKEGIKEGEYTFVKESNSTMSSNSLMEAK
jgi:hypothetical protein